MMTLIFTLPSFAQPTPGGAIHIQSRSDISTIRNQVLAENPNSKIKNERVEVEGASLPQGIASRPSTTTEVNQLMKEPDQTPIINLDPNAKNIFRNLLSKKLRNRNSGKSQDGKPTEFPEFNAFIQDPSDENYITALQHYFPNLNLEKTLFVHHPQSPYTTVIADRNLKYFYELVELYKDPEFKNRWFPPVVIASEKAADPEPKEKTTKRESGHVRKTYLPIGLKHHRHPGPKKHYGCYFKHH